LAQPSFGPLAYSAAGMQQSWKHAAQVKAAIKAILELGQITMAVFIEIESMVRSSDRRFEIAQYGVDPVKTTHFSTLAVISDNLALMIAPRGGDRSKTSQAIRNHRSGRSQVILGPLANFLAAESLNPTEHSAQRVSFITGFDSGDKGNLVLRTPSSFAAWKFTSQVGIVELHSLGQDDLFLAFVHHFHEFVLDPPSASVAYAQQAFQFQSGQAGFTLGYQVHGEKPLT
jgi:hypothetical protein